MLRQFQQIQNCRRDKDPYRDSFNRIFCYSHALADSILSRPNFTKLCTGVTILYCACDVYDKLFKISKKQQNNILNIKPLQTCQYDRTVIVYYIPYIAAVNSVIWESIGSYLVPAYTVDRITYITKRILSKIKSGRLKLYLPHIIGIASLPFIMAPIDNGVNKLIEISQIKKMNLIRDAYHVNYIRLLGYAFVISKTAYYALHSKQQIVNLCFGISHIYSFVDAIDKCYKTTQIYFSNCNTTENNISRIFEDVVYKYQSLFTAVDVFIWQALASFLLPSYMISGIRFLTLQSIDPAQTQGSRRKIVPAIVALSILIIPIDRIVDALFELMYCKLFS